MNVARQAGCRLKYTLLVVVVTCLFGGFAAGAQPIIYVDDDASGSGDGSSWSNAFTSLQDALAAAATGDQLWIAEGTYRPDQGSSVAAGDRTTSFRIESGQTLIGGFLGTETSVEDRLGSRDNTVLSGDLLENDVGAAESGNTSRLDNSAHVMVASTGPLDTLVIESVTIASGFSDDGRGGGLAVGTGNIHIDDVAFVSNYASERGGAVYIPGGHIMFRNTVVRDNRSDETLGGGLYLAARAELFDVAIVGNAGGGITVTDDGGLLAVNVSFVGNSSAGYGGAIYTEQGVRPAQPFVLVNCLIQGNSAVRGGGIFSLDRPIEIYNSTIAHNTADEGGAGVFHLAVDTLRVYNSIVWGNSSTIGEDQLQTNSSDGVVSLSSSLLQGQLASGVFDDGQTISGDPIFADSIGVDVMPGTGDEDYSLGAASPAIDAGDNAYLAADFLDADADGDSTEYVPVDIVGNKRVHEIGAPNVDIGAYEYGAEPLDVKDRPDLPRSTCRVFPNPFGSEVNINPIGVRQHDIRVVDLLGRTLALTTGTPTPGEAIAVRLANGASGLVFITVADGDRRCSATAVRLVR